MKTQRRFILLAFLLIMLVGCKKVDMLGLYGHWDLSMGIDNQTETELITEWVGTYESYSHSIPKNETGGLYFGRFDGDKELQFPHEEDVVKMMEKVSIYRYVDGEKQYLPRRYFESMSFYEVKDNGWDMGAEMVSYNITINEDMFSE